MKKKKEDRQKIGKRTRAEERLKNSVWRDEEKVQWLTEKKVKEEKIQSRFGAKNRSRR